MPQENHFHFIGICGTAMGSVAAAMKRKGYTITGSDAQVYPPMSDYLHSAGIEIANGYAAENIPSTADVVVIGNALSRGNDEVEAALDQGLLYRSLPEVLKEHFLRGKRNLIVSGTHGKTTTSSLLTWLFVHAERNPSWMIGGLPQNLGSGAHFTDSEINVLEGDEYDTAFFDKRSKFLHYLPEVAIINNIEFDHADIYDDLAQIQRSFQYLLRVVPRHGRAIINGDDPACLEVIRDAPCPVTTVGFGSECDLRIHKTLYQPTVSEFHLNDRAFAVPMPGECNVRNAAMAIAAAELGGLADDQIRDGLTSFRGIARRQEVRGEVNGIKVIDDFAHHPTAIRLAIEALRQQYPTARLWAIFEPRSNTTIRKIFQTEIAAGLAAADCAIIAPIPQPEKIDPADRLDPEQVARDIPDGKGRHLPSVEAIVTTVAKEAQPGDVIAILSNGGFDNIHQKLLESLACQRDLSGKS